MFHASLPGSLQITDDSHETALSIILGPHCMEPYPNNLQWICVSILYTRTGTNRSRPESERLDAVGNDDLDDRVVFGRLDLASNLSGVFV